MVRKLLLAILMAILIGSILTAVMVISPARGQQSANGKIYNVNGLTSQVTVAFSATPTFTFTTNSFETIFLITLTGNVTSSTMAGTFFTGSDICFIITQDATGSRSFTYPTTILNPAPIITTPSAVSASCYSNTDGTHWQNLDVTPGTAATSTSVNAQTGTSYTIGASDCNTKLVTFSNTATVAVTLPQANGSFASCVLNLLNINKGTVTITPTTSTITPSDSGGTITLLGGTAGVGGQGVTFYSDGSNWFCPQRNKWYLQTITPATPTTDQLVNPANNATFSSTLTLPANLPIGTQVDIYLSGNWVITTSGNFQWNLDFQDAIPVSYCTGDTMFTVFSNGVNGGGSGNFLMTCTIMIRATGASGALRHMMFDTRWAGDSSSSCTNVNTQTAAGGCYPGYNESDTRINGLDKTFDDTTTKTLSIHFIPGGGVTATNLTLNLLDLSMRIQLP